MNVDSILKAVRGIVRLRGGTDNTLIGNTGDKLNVEATFSPSDDTQASDLRSEVVITSTLNAILCELKIHTLHLEQITEERFTKIKGVEDDY